MNAVKIAITLDQRVLNQLDKLVSRRIFPNRSRAIQQAIIEQLQRLKKDRFLAECAKLDPTEEKALAEEGMAGVIDTWPRY